MNFQTWVTLAGIVCTIVVTVTTWGFLTGRWSTSEAHRIARLDEQIQQWRDESNRRFDEAGEQTSKAMTYIQGMELRFTREFSNRDLTDERFSENRRDHDRFSNELAKLERSIQKRREGD